jgi:hypothetical protein
MRPHQRSCGFATDDKLRSESRQAQHTLNGQDAARRDHGVRDMTTGELQRARRDLEASQ